MTPETSISTLPFVGPKYEKLLANLGIKTVRDLLYHLPSRYVDLSKIIPVDKLETDETQVIQARVWEIKKTRIAGGRVLINVLVGDDSGSIQLTWFNQPYIEKTLHQGQEYRFAGEVELKFGRMQMTNPQFELASRPMVHTGRLVPVYPQTAGVSSKWLRARIAPLLSKADELTPEFLPDDTIERHNLLLLPAAISQLHAPENIEQAQQARHRLAFDEMLLLQLAAALRKEEWQEGRRAERLAVDGSQLTEWIKCLPFSLTGAQKREVGAILEDLVKETPMNRLLEGDVGSGKTVVAWLTALAAVSNGYQVAVMAPTSVLAQQHYLTFQALLETSGVHRSPFTVHRKKSANRQPSTVNVSLRTSKSKSAPADITIGTHALLSEGVTFDRLGLVIIDEQHRFGVEQRAALMAKAGRGVHVLTMTATPIPRTLALTAYGDLDVSILDELPAGRLPIRTHMVPERKRQDMYGFLRQHMEAGEQVFIICPLIEQSESLQSVRAATSEFERLQRLFPDQRLALLHGRMKPQEKDQALAAFKDHQFDLLVATPVVEVGIDVPNATILVIEGAERFGLAQLHQLRGRVGRGDVQSFCFLLSDATDVSDVQRLQHLEHEHSGIRLAELDLQTRGPGEVYGVRQSGIPELKAASFFDLPLIEATRDEAARLIAADALSTYPALSEHVRDAQRLVEMN